VKPHEKKLTDAVLNIVRGSLEFVGNQSKDDKEELEDNGGDRNDEQKDNKSEKRSCNEVHMQTKKRRQETSDLEEEEVQLCVFCKLTVCKRAKKSKPGVICTICGQVFKTPQGLGSHKCGGRCTSKVE